MVAIILTVFIACGHKDNVAKSTTHSIEQQESSSEVPKTPAKENISEDSIAADCYAKCIEVSQPQARGIDSIEADCKKSCLTKRTPMLEPVQDDSPSEE